MSSIQKTKQNKINITSHITVTTFTGVGGGWQGVWEGEGEGTGVGM